MACNKLRVSQAARRIGKSESWLRLHDAYFKPEVIGSWRVYDLDKLDTDAAKLLDRDPDEMSVSEAARFLGWAYMTVVAHDEDLKPEYRPRGTQMVQRVYSRKKLVAYRAQGGR